MKRRLKTAVAITTLAMTTSASLNAEACDRGGRRSFFSRSRVSVGVTPYRHYSPPVYQQPQVVYQQPAQNFPPAQPMPRPAQPQFQPQSQVQPQRQVQPQPQRQFQPQLQSQRQVQPQPQVQRQVQSQPQLQSQPRRVAAKPLASPAVPAKRAVVQTSATQASVPQVNAESTALQMLASIDTAAFESEADASSSSSVVTTPQIPEFGPAADSSLAAHVGTWSVKLPGSQSVELVLSSDGKFTWTATKSNSSNNFEGQYRLENDRLTLVRSTDLQQMAGSWTGSGQGFTFKLDGATAGGLAFTRG